MAVGWLGEPQEIRENVRLVRFRSSPGIFACFNRIVGATFSFQYKIKKNKCVFLPPRDVFLKPQVLFLLPKNCPFSLVSLRASPHFLERLRPEVPQGEEMRITYGFSKKNM